MIAAPALFEEANRTRAFLVRILRLLGVHGIAGALPDLPGQGESLLPTHQATLAGWRDAFATAARHVSAVATVSIRGGALVDGPAPVSALWRLSPITGAEQVKELWRIRQAAHDRPKLRYDPARFIAELDVEVAGNRLAPGLLAAMNIAEPSSDAPVRTVRLDTNPRPADLKLPGRPLWRASEPDVDEPLAQALADDIAAWVHACVA
ncbi:hypothetical protein [Sphingomonas lenta]|uniref:hypothetical protein n=1 Tax=Sphingomonas lenta TaxID=1141887 RepID=UPI001FE866E7|nr:hypothetical protein [Sphingomonas lenta]